MLIKLVAAFLFAGPAFAHTGPPLCEAEIVNRPMLQTHFEPPTKQEVADIRSNLGRKNADYQMAFWFAREFGDHFAEIVFGVNPNPKERLNIVVALGGAEPLSVFLRQLADARGYKNVNIIDVYLSTKIMRPWEAKVPRNADDIFDEDFKVVKGIGPLPPNAIGLGERPDGPNTDQDIVQYLRQLGVFKNAERIVVVDTGFYGTSVEVVNYAGKQLRSTIPVTGALVHYNGRSICANRVPVKGLFRFGRTPEDEFSSCQWAYYMDDGHLPRDSNGGTYGFAFQRSSPSPKALVRDVHGRWVPDVQLFTDKKSILRHQAMALGFWDALHNTRPESEVPHRRTDK